jgi:predicted Fe-Mo cluster-binding NifX family protein
MKIAVSAEGATLEAAASPVFGRCPYYVFVDTETMEAVGVDNPAMSAGGGAGIQAAQFVMEQGAKAVVSGNLGPNADQVFQASGVPVYFFGGGTVHEAVDAFKNGKLEKGGANVAAHAGMGMLQRGSGRGMGRRQGMGRGMGMDGAPASAPADPGPAASDELGELREAARNLRAQLADIVERIDKLEKEG